MLVERALGGGADADAAFAELMRRHRSRIVRFATRRTGSPALGDEVAADVVELAWRSLGSLRDADRFVPWLMRMTARRLVDHHRANERRRRREERADAVGRPLRVVTDPGDLVASADSDERLRAAIGRLGSAHQEIIMLRFHADLSPVDAAAALGISPGTAGVRLHRAVTALRRELVSSGDAWEPTGRSRHE